MVLVGLAGALDRDRWTPLVATSEEPAFRSLLADVDVESIPVPMGHLNGSGAAVPIHLTAAVRAVSRLVRRRHIDLIHTGHRTDVDRFYAAADVVVYTAVRPEGLPTVLLEAMRYSRPTVASAIGGAVDIVEDGVTGWCVRPDDVDDLAGGVLRLLGDPDRARAMGVNGRRRLARGFDRREQVARTMGIYDTAVRRTTRG